MVRGNFQKRLETAARRKTAKEKKQQQTEQKRHYKSFFQDVLAMLDRHNDAIQRRVTRSIQEKQTPSSIQSSSWDIHIWTDSLPSTSPPFLDLVVEDDGGSKSKHNKAAANDGSSNNKATGRKKHPRSRDASDTETSTGASAAEGRMKKMCKRQFFHGKCLDSGKKGGCSCYHFTKKVPTLWSTFIRQQHKGSDMNQILVDSEAACDVDPDGLEIYYVSVPLHGLVSQSSSSQDDPADAQVPATISNQITSTLANNSW